MHRMGVLRIRRILLLGLIMIAGVIAQLEMIILPIIGRPIFCKNIAESICVMRIRGRLQALMLREVLSRKMRTV